MLYTPYGTPMLGVAKKRKRRRLVRIVPYCPVRKTRSHVSHTHDHAARQTDEAA